MRPPLTPIILSTLLLAGCATSADPANGGFISGVNGLLSGGYDKRVNQQSSDLAQLQAQRAAAEAEASRTNAALAARQRSVVALRGDVAKLDRSLKETQAKAAQQRARNVSLSEKDRQLMTELQAAQQRLAILQKQLASSTSADEYEAAKQEYSALQVAIDTIQQQMKGDQ